MKKEKRNSVKRVKKPGLAMEISECSGDDRNESRRKGETSIPVKKPSGIVDLISRIPRFEKKRSDVVSPHRIRLELYAKRMHAQQ